MGTLLYFVALIVIGVLRALPLRWVARLGRAGGMMFYGLDARHRKVALKNLNRCFGGEMSPEVIRGWARENFRRIGESFACGIKTAFLSSETLKRHVQLAGSEKIAPFIPNRPPQSRIIAIGHFGNFEVFTRLGDHAPGFQCGTTYRGVDHPALDRLMKSLRERSGCRFFERRSEAGALRAAMNGTGLLLGLLADQHAGHRGLRLPFLGHECSTSAAPAVFALRYQCPLYTAICYRVALGQWRIEIGDEIPTHENGVARSVEAISMEINRAFEIAVRRDPANWFWVHERWKPAKAKFGRPRPSDLSPTPFVDIPP